MDKKGKIRIAFFGTPEFATDVLNELQNYGNTIPLDLIITAPNRPVGRKLIITPPPIKIWADKNQIRTLQPEKLDEVFTRLAKLS